jgi:hypothetical protein
MVKAAFNKNNLCPSKQNFVLRTKAANFYILIMICMVLKLGHFGKQIRNLYGAET